jgi:hypothetical protein
MKDGVRILLALLVVYVMFDIVMALVLQEQHPGLLKDAAELLALSAGRKYVLISLAVALVAGYLSYVYLKC